MRPIFRPKARLKDCWPSRVGSGIDAGPNSSAWSCADFILRADFVFEEAECATSGGGATRLPVPGGDKGADSAMRSVCAGRSNVAGTAADLGIEFFALFSRSGCGI